MKLIKQVMEEAEKRTLLELGQIVDQIRLQLLEEGETLTEDEIVERARIQYSITKQLPPNIIEESKRPGFWSESMTVDEFKKMLVEEYGLNPEDD